MIFETSPLRSDARKWTDGEVTAIVVDDEPLFIHGKIHTVVRELTGQGGFWFRDAVTGTEGFILTGSCRGVVKVR